VHSRPKCSQEGCERDALKDFGGVCWRHREKSRLELMGARDTIAIAKFNLPPSSWAAEG
jgi:hypothetical protein